MTPDPRWLEILKASGWQTAAISLACGVMLWASHKGWLPPFEPWLVQIVAAAMVICRFLALASFISNATIQIGKWSPALKPAVPRSFTTIVLTSGCDRLSELANYFVMPMA